MVEFGHFILEHNNWPVSQFNMFSQIHKHLDLYHVVIPREEVIWDYGHENVMPVQNLLAS